MGLPSLRMEILAFTGSISTGGLPRDSSRLSPKTFIPVFLARATATTSRRFDESIEAWMRAGEVSRAARTALVAVNEGRLQPTVPAFAAAHRAAEQTSHHTLTARLFELESNWQRAAHAWRAAGNHAKAAENFRRAGLFNDAAQSEVDAGRPRESVLLRIQRIRSLRQKLNVSQNELAQLLGISVSGVRTWEYDISKPRGKNREALVALRKLGRRDVKRMLEALEE